jgi:methionine-rich copper-binding protein CopC
VRTQGRVRRSAAVSAWLATGWLAWVVCALLAAGPASAHAELTATTPAQGATVTRLPAQVSLTFSEPVARPVAVVVTGPDGATVSGGGPRIDGGTVTQPVTGSAAAGRYTVSYRAVSDDGHPVSGTVSFMVGDTAADPAVTEPAEPAEAGIDTGLLAWLVGGVLAALAVCAVAVTRLAHGRDD